jgi:hypothetical protein
VHIVHLSEVAAVVARRVDGLDASKAQNIILAGIGLPGEEVGIDAVEIEDALFTAIDEDLTYDPEWDEDWSLDEEDVPEDLFEVRALIEAEALSLRAV